ncbi:MAG: DUF3592 domain-containing protein [Lachnospiraceae bacterium]|nr:DUF3592 domain-containing protein [Lachnospiraceae bacterium]
MAVKIVKVIFILSGVICSLLGVYLKFFQTKGFRSTTAVIDHIEEDYRGKDAEGVADYRHIVYVNYEVNGIAYQGESDYYESGYREGSRIKIFYDPANPQIIHGDSGKSALIALLVGPILILSGLAMMFFNWPAR